MSFWEFNTTSLFPSRAAPKVIFSYRDELTIIILWIFEFIPHQKYDYGHYYASNSGGNNGGGSRTKYPLPKGSK
jgi:hypothetical protein